MGMIRKTILALLILAALLTVPRRLDDASVITLLPIGEPGKILIWKENSWQWVYP